MSENIASKILDSIKKKDIKPKPKWEFLVREYAIWGLGIFSILIGALAFAVIVYLVVNNDWDVYGEVNSNIFAFIFLTLPYFWLVLVAGLVLAVIYNFRHTKYGYRYHWAIVVLGSIFLSVGLGVIFHRVGWGEAIDDTLGRRAPLYGTVINPRLHLWMQPEQGLLAGVVVEVITPEEFFLYDLSREKWLVEAHNTLFHPMIIIEPGREIKMIGEMIGQHEFEAFNIIPVGPGRGQFPTDLDW